MNQSEIDQFKKNGYLILKSYIHESIIFNLIASIEVMVDKMLSLSKDNDFSAKVQELENIDHQSVYNIQKTMATSSISVELITEIDLSGLHSILYGVEKKRIHNHLFQTPIQFPKDKRFDFSWHQESSSYIGGSKILTCWFPILQKVDSYYGSVEIIPGSHLRGNRESNHKVRSSGLNEWVIIPSEDELEKIMTVEMEPGDVLLFDSDLLHRSVENISDKIRVTGIARTADICSLPRIHPIAEPVSYLSDDYIK